MENLKYLPYIDKRQHIITLKDLFSYYNVTKLTGKGNLRMIYGRKDKRDLVVTIFNVYIAELFDVFIEGGLVFNFPDSNPPKMTFKQVSEDVVRKARGKGKLKMLDPLGSNFKGVETVIKVPSKEAFYTYQVILSKNFQQKIYDKLNAGKRLGGIKDVHWKEFMPTIYNSFDKIDKSALDDIVLYGLRKMNYFMGKSLEMYFGNTNMGEYIYIGKQANKIKDPELRRKILEKQYRKKLRWHFQASKVKAEHSYYALTEEMYERVKRGELINTVMKKIKEECLIGEPWYRYIMRTSLKSHQYVALIKDYDASGDELIFIKPEIKKKDDA